jgi:hypothetical protein
VTGCFGFVDLEAGEGLGGGAGDLGDQAAATVVVVDPPGGVRGLDGQGPSDVDDADVDALFGLTWLTVMVFGRA